MIEEGRAISENMMRLEKSWRCSLFIGVRQRACPNSVVFEKKAPK